MPKLTTWPGADSELRALLQAISRLLFGRRLADRLRQEEHALSEVPGSI